MPKKSNEEFQKDVLKILEQQREDLELFKKEIKGEVAEKKEGIVQKEQIDKESGYSYVINIMTSTKVPLPEEEIGRRIAEISKIIKPLMKVYQLSMLKCNVIKVYE